MFTSLYIILKQLINYLIKLIFEIHGNTREI